MDQQARKRFVLEGSISGFLSSPCVFDLHIHGDGTLSGTTTPTVAAAQMGASASSTCKHDNICEQEDDPLDTYLLFDGAAEESQSENGDGGGFLLNVQFQLSKRSGLPGLVHVIHLAGTLSPETGLHGRWNVSGSLGRLVSDRDGDADREFHLTLREFASIASDEEIVSLYPLTQGSYRFKGAAFGDNGFRYDAQWCVELHGDGILTGHSKEDDNAPQICKLEGTWTRDNMRILQYYIVKGVLGKYKIDATVHGGGFRGRWVSVDAPESQNERGYHDFALVEATRKWNHRDHLVYPRPFQEVVKLCLLSSVRCQGQSSSLPSNLWSHVFSFCGFHWFRS